MKTREYYDEQTHYIHQVITYEDGTEQDMKTVRVKDAQQAKAVINAWNLRAKADARRH